MKKYLILFLLILFSSSLLFALSIENSQVVPEEYRQMVIENLEKTLETRIDTEVYIQEFLEIEIDEEIQISFSVLIEDNAYKVLFRSKKDKTLEKTLASEIEKAFYYLPTNVDGLKMDYIYNTALMALTGEEDIKKGTNFLAKGINGDNIARLIVKEKEDGFIRLSPIYSKGLYPGLSLQKTNGYEIYASGLLAIKEEKVDMAASIGILNSSWIYPISPVVELKLKFTPAIRFHVALGINYEFLLSEFEHDSFFMIKNASLGANALIGGCFDKEIGYGASFEIYYKLNFSNSINLRLGFDYSRYIVNKIVNDDQALELSIGVRFWRN